MCVRSLFELSKKRTWLLPVTRLEVFCGMRFGQCHQGGVHALVVSSCITCDSCFCSPPLRGSFRDSFSAVLLANSASRVLTESVSCCSSLVASVTTCCA